MSTFAMAMDAPASRLPANSSATGLSSRSAMPAASSTSDAATAVSRPIRRASRGARGEKAPKHNTGAVVSSPAVAAESPVSTCRLRSVDASAAREAQGVVAVVTAEDLGDLEPIPAGLPMVPAAMTRPWLAADRVRFVGDIVAVVLTEERYQGEDAAEMVEVDVDPLPAVVTTADAAKDEVLLFPDAGTNVMATFGEPAPADFFDGCEVVVRQRIVNQRVAPVPLETRAAAAAWGDDGRVTVWCTNQGAQQAKSQIAGWLGLDEQLVHLVTPDVGGGFGAKIGADPEYAFVAWLARHAGR